MVVQYTTAQALLVPVAMVGVAGIFITLMVIANWIYDKLKRRKE